MLIISVWLICGGMKKYCQKRRKRKLVKSNLLRIQSLGQIVSFEIFDYPTQKNNNLNI